MKKISIGIYVDGELERLRWTLASLNANAPHDVELLLLLDGVALNGLFRGHLLHLHAHRRPASPDSTEH